MILVSALAVFLPVWSLNLVGLVVGILLWISLVPVLRYLAKRDPQMFKVYMRHVRYKGYYPARSTPFRVDKSSMMNKGRM